MKKKKFKATASIWWNVATWNRQKELPEISVTAFTKKEAALQASDKFHEMAKKYVAGNEYTMNLFRGWV